MTIARVRSVWSGPQIQGGGFTDLYFFGSAGSEGAMATAVRNFWVAIGPLVCTGNSVQVSSEVTNLDEETGNVVSIVTLGSAPAIVNGSQAGDPLPPATQGLCRWLTDGIVRNRRVRGRTFLPAMGETPSTGGIPTAGTITLVNTAGAALIADATTQLVVWSRPQGGTGGSQHTVLTPSMWAKWAVLRSRRD